MKTRIWIKLSSYDHRLLDHSIKKIIKLVTDCGSVVKGPIPLPTKKEVFTICRSPHVNKISREQFERLTHRRLIIIANISRKGAENLKNFITPAGISTKVIIKK